MVRIRGRIGDWPVDLTLELDAEDWAQLAQHVAVTPTPSVVAATPVADAGDALWQTALQLVRDKLRRLESSFAEWESVTRSTDG